MPFLLRATLAWVAVHFLIGVPFVYANRMGAAWIGAAVALTLLGIPSYLFSKQHVTQSAWVAVCGGTLTAGTLVILSGGIRGPLLTQVAVAVVGTVLLGYRGGLASAFFSLALDLVITLFQGAGGQLPQPFPVLPIALWFQMTTSLLIVVPVLAAAISRLRNTLLASQAQCEELTRSRAELLDQRQLLARCGDALISVDENRVVTFWNRAAEKVFGWRTDEAVGTHVEQIGLTLDPEIRRSVIQLGEWNGPLTFSSRAGMQLDLEATVASLHSGEGAFTGMVAAFRDVTERKKVEAALRENEERFSKAFHDAPVLMSISSMVDDRFLDVNGYALEISGFTREEVIGKTSTELGWISPADRGLIACLLKYEGKVTGLELSLTRKDGSPVECLYSGHVITVQGKRCVLSISIDISERKRAEERLSEEALRRRLLMEESIDGIVMLDAELKIVEANRQFAQGLGYSMAEIRGLSISEFDVSNVQADMLKAARQGRERRQVFETKHRRKDGTVYDAEVSAAMEELGGCLFVFSVVRDITARKQAERILLESEHRLLEAQRLAQIGSWEHDHRTNTMLWSEEMHRISGTDPAKFRFTQHALMKLVHPDDRTRLDRSYAEACGRHEPFDILFRLRLPDGSVKHLHARSETNYDRQGLPLLTMGTCQDITERVLAEQALQQKTEELNSYFDLSRDLLLIATSDARIRRTNAEWERMLGYSSAELGSMRLTELAHPDDVQAILEMTARSTKRQPSSEVVSRLRTIDGRYRSIEWRCYPNGGLLYAVGRDITERRANEEALRESEETLRLAIGSSLLGTFDCYIQTERFLWSERTRQLFGLNSDTEITPELFKKAIHPDDQHYVWQTIEAACRGENGGLATVEHRTIGIDDGIERWVSATMRVLHDGAGHATRFVGVVKDVTEQKRADQELRANLEALAAEKERAEAATNAKSNFLSTMSHEIRTPMNAIIGMTGVLLDTELSATQHDYATTVRTSAASLLTIVNDILDFSKIESGKVEIEAIPFNLKTAVEDVLELVALTAHEKSLELALRYAPEAPCHFTGDPGRIRQVLLNLVSNAVKFTEKGYVLVEVDWETAPAGKQIRLSVHDTGIGIPKQKQDLLFSRFTQLDSSTTRRYGGTGLGLAIARQLSELMGGMVSVASTPGEGSSFFCTLPLNEFEGVVSPPCDVSELRGVRILILEEQPVTRFVLSECCENWGMEVSEAASDEEALETLDLLRGRGAAPEMLLIGEGPRVRQLREFADFATVLLTTGPDRTDSTSGPPANVIASLPKPVRAEQLAAALVQGRRPGVSGLSNLAAHTTAESRRVSSTSTESVFRGSRILLAEDNPVNQKVARAVLAKFGCKVEVASNGIEALQLTSTLPFDLVLMDCQMPEMDGYEATEAIRNLPGETSRIPIIALTASAMSGDRNRCLAASMNDYLTKPIDAKALRECLGRWLQTQTGDVQVM